MLIRPTHTSPKESSSHTSFNPNQSQSSQHGKPHSSISILLGVPAETLTGITSYLDPPSLLSLARVHSWLHLHVKDDGTWRRAFLCQFLNIAPESDVVQDQSKSLMLRRSENSWRNEFIVRYRLIRRWERSRNPTVSHIPVYSQISSMHMMPGPNPALLTSSVQYGIVSRSLPLNGKILPGFLDASGSRLGQGVGNPNAEFSPDVSACVLSSEGGTAKIVWGFRHGEVGVMTAPRVLDPSRRAIGNMVRCDVLDEHTGAVLDAVWDHPDKASKAVGAIATAGADGLVKLWDAKTLRCLWTSGRKPGVGPEACLKIAVSLAQGIIVAVDRSGDVVFWTFQTQLDVDSLSVTSVEEHRVPCPVKLGEESNTRPTVSFLHLDSYAATPTILVAYEDHPYFYRLRKGRGTDSVELTAFGDASFGSFISALAPYFSATESTFVLTGDTIGCVSVYDWNTSPDASPSSPTAVQCVKRFEAHEDGSGVTALAWNGLTLVTGSVLGTSDIWDGLTFEHLRSFPSPVPRVRGGGRAHTRDGDRGPTRQILLGPERDVVLVSVGDRVLAWKAGPVSSRNGSGGVRGRHSPGSAGKKKKDKHGKYLEQVELRQTVSEAKSMLKTESDRVRRANGKAKEQLVHLDNMGLNESEAVEYLLMLSRDEALQREMSTEEEDVFEVDSDSDEAGLTPSYILPSHLAALGFDRSGSGLSTPRTTTTRKFSTAISEEAPESQSPDSTDGLTEPENNKTGSTAVPSSVSSASSSASLLRTDFKRPISTSSAWNVPLQKRTSPPSSSSSASVSSVISSSSSSWSLRRANVNEDDMDDELRLAIELSLAEAISLGQDV